MRFLIVGIGHSYLGVGIGMILLGLADASVVKQQNGDPSGWSGNMLHRFPIITIMNGICNVLHAAGTFWNHACECKQGGVLDVAGMLSVSAFPIM
jgi:hypothetical protein